MDGALMEVGPYKLKNDHTLEYNEGSWDEFANLLFVDQPVGTGFSYVNSDSYLHELNNMAAHFIIFLEKFFEAFPEYEKDDVCTVEEMWANIDIFRFTSLANPTPVNIYPILRELSRSGTRTLQAAAR